ncbi:MAG: N-acetyltransferase [Phycisphaeraceae bacterium]|nr:MAG: N-acetyltransferase [Phycisphaeraceae bacterium]
MTHDQAVTRPDPAAGTHAFVIRPLVESDKGWVREALKRYWASMRQVTKGRLHQADELPGFAAMRDGEPVGLLTYEIRDNQCEIITHNSLAGHGGIGSCLLAEVRKLAREKGCSRLWCITTNDNMPALRFYQRREFDLVALHRGAIAEGRKLKPEIPEVGMDGIRIRHEVELEYKL